MPNKNFFKKNQKDIYIYIYMDLTLLWALVYAFVSQLPIEARPVIYLLY